MVDQRERMIQTDELLAGETAREDKQTARRNEQVFYRHKRRLTPTL